MPTAYISHPACLLHEMGPWHPESPARLSAIEKQLRADGLYEGLRHYEAPRVGREDLLRVHDVRYVDAIAAAVPAEGYVELDPDTVLCPMSLEAASRAAGGAVLAVDKVMSGEVANAFVAVRPPGHHATRRRAMGFCIFNNVAIAAAHALAGYGLARVAIVDFDVHHGNGTEAIFTDEPRLLLASTFQHPFYPYSGADTVSGHIVNVPLPAGTDGVAYRAAFAARILPALEDFRPEFVFFSAGFDAHRDDPLAQLALTEDDYAWITAEVMAVTRRHAHDRIVSLLEGGYNLGALARSAAAHIRVLAGLGMPRVR